MAKPSKKTTQANIGFEKQIWDAACVLWGHIPLRQVLFCKFMHKKQIFPSPYRLSKLYLPSIPRAVPSAENQRAVRRIPGWGTLPRPSFFS